MSKKSFDLPAVSFFSIKDDIEEITEGTFEDKVLHASANGEYVLVQFFSKACIPCKQQLFVLEQLKERWNISVVKIDAHVARQTAAVFKVSAVPTLKLYYDGKPFQTVIGFKTLFELEDIFGWDYKERIKHG